MGGGGGGDSPATSDTSSAAAGFDAPAPRRRPPPSSRGSAGRRYADDEPGDYDDDEDVDDFSDFGGGARQQQRPRGGASGRGGGRGGRGDRGGGGFRGRERERERGSGDRRPLGRDRGYDNKNGNARGGGGGGYGGGDDGDGRERSVWQERHDEKKRNRTEPTLAERLQGEAVFGLNPVREVLRTRRREVYHVWVQEGSDASDDASLLSAAEALDLKIERVSKHDLNMLTGNPPRPHNGVVVDASPLEPVPMDSLPSWDGSGAPPLWLALDEVVDPQNLGAVLRSAHFLGVAGVVVCAKNSAPLSPVVSKASSGAMEAMRVHSVGVMHRFLARCVEEGWDVYGAAAEAGAGGFQKYRVPLCVCLLSVREP